MNCQLCDQRTFYYGKFTPCLDCKVTKSANIERETSTKKQEKPYWITLMENSGLF